MKKFFQISIITYWFIIIIGAFFPGLFHSLVTQPVHGLKFLAILKGETSAKDLWFLPETTSEKGVIRYDREKSWGDYTLFSDTSSNEATLIDMNGRIVRKWNTAFPTENLSYPDDITTTRVFPDPKNPENIYALYMGLKIYFNHYGLKKFDKNSNLLWHNTHTLHHDIIFIENGDMLSFERRLNYKGHPALPQITTPIHEEYLVFLNKEGEIYHEISIIEAFMDSPYKSVLETLGLYRENIIPPEDLIHPNKIEIVPQHIAQSFPNIAPNSLMLSFRNLDMLAFLDLDTEKITWALYGPWRKQHAAQFLDNGHILLLDNFGHNGPGGRSRLLEINLKDMSIVWEYTGTPEKPFFTVFNGMLDVLPNGNILVTETHSGRIFEITKDKKIVWDYYIDTRIEHPDGHPRVPSVVSAQRFSKDELPFLHAN